MAEFPYTGITPALPPKVNLFTEPAKVTAGETILFFRSLPDQPAGQGWGITYVLRNGGGAGITFASIADGDNHKVEVASDVTVEWKAGDYKIQGLAVNSLDGKVKNIYEGFISISPKLQAVDPGLDQRSKWTVIRDNCLEVLTRRASDDLLDSSIEGSSFRKMDYNQLLALYDRAQQIVMNEQAEARAAQGLGNGRTIFTSFTRPL